MTRATLHTVAKKAGVSYQTVSNTINNSKTVKPETRAKVEAAIKELGFVPSFAAKALREAKTMNLGCVFYLTGELDISDPYTNTVQATIAKAAKSHNYSLLTYHFYESNPNELELLKQHVLQGRMDGLIVVGTSAPEAMLEELSQWGIPLTIFDRTQHQQTSVGLQYAEGIAALLQHLYARGKRRIAFVSGAQNDHSESGEERLGSFITLSQSMGLDFEPAYIYEGNWGFASGKSALNYFTSLPNPPEAIMCANDRMALGVISAARTRGIAVPEQLAITGFDGFEFTQYVTPTLTTVEMPFEKIGETVVSTLLNIISGEGSPSQRLALVLRVGESS